LSRSSKELGSLKIASRSHLSKKKVIIWSTPVNDDTEIDRIISDNSLMIVLEEKNEYYRVVVENNHVGWIHKDNTTDIDDP
jgi:hypothetical protein